jgi:HK97 family phage portal protein
MAFVVTAGQIARVDPQNYYRGWGYPSAMHSQIQLDSTTWMTYESVWRSQPAVRTVIGFLARNVAQLGIDPYRRVSQTDRQKVPDHPLGRLLEDPFPGSKWTKYRLMSWTMHELGIFDCAYWIKGRASDGTPTLLPMSRRYLEPIGDNPIQAQAYRLTGSNGYRDLDPDSVVHFHGYDPDDNRNGVSPIETLRQILAEEYSAGQYREQMWRKGARVSGYISRDVKAPRWSDDARNRFRADWREYEGNSMQSGGTPVLEDGMTYTASGITPRDAQYVEARKLTREEVAVAYYINPAMLGLMDGTTTGNIPELHKMLYMDTLGPILTMLSQDIERQILPDLDPAGDVYVEFNLAEKLRGSFEEQAAAISSSVGGPWMTRSEARALHNLSHLPEADELITPLNVTQGGLASPRDTAPNEPHNEESNGQLPKPRAPKEVGA